MTETRNVLQGVEVKQGHFGYTLRFNVSDDNGAVDFTGCTIAMKVWKEGASSVTWTLTGSNAGSGAVDVAVTVNDFTLSGNYLGEIEWTKTGIKDGTETFPVKVIPSV